MHDQALAFVFWAALWAPAMVGCRGEDSTEPARGGQAVRAAPTRAVEVKPLDERQVRPMIAGHRGRVLLLNAWASWCNPCVEELPGIARLARELAGRGLAVVTVSTDEKADEAKMRAILGRSEQRGPLSHFVARADDYEAFVNAVHRGWIGGVPATFVFDRRGKLRYHHLGKRSYAQLRGVVSPLL